MQKRHQRRKGVAIAALGVLSVTPDAALVRWTQRFLIGGSEAPLLFWKNMSAFCFGLGLSLSVCSVNWKTIREGWFYFTLAALCQGFTAITFPISFVLTYASNVLVVNSVSPMFSALLGWMVLGEHLPRRTAIALVSSTASVCLMFGDQLADGNLGDALALVNAFVNALFLVTVRAGLRKYPDLPVPISATVGTLFGAIFALAFWGNVDDFDRPEQFFVPIVLDGICLAGILVALSIAPRYTSAAEISLLSLIEVVLAPVWVYFFFGEVPPLSTVLGGILLITVQIVHELANVRADQAAARGSNSSNAPTAVHHHLLAAPSSSSSSDRLESGHQLRPKNNAGGGGGGAGPGGAPHAYATFKPQEKN